uniref:Uncharacterized protein n=1 Tax=Magallana gigas TaxID=29159 RepID=K1QZQ5_MAGGI
MPRPSEEGGGGVMSKTPSHGTRKPAPKSVYLEMMESTATGKTDQDRPLPIGAKGGRPRTMPPKKSLLLTPPSYYLRSTMWMKLEPDWSKGKEDLLKTKIC